MQQGIANVSGVAIRRFGVRVGRVKAHDVARLEEKRADRHRHHPRQHRIDAGAQIPIGLGAAKYLGFDLEVVGEHFLAELATAQRTILEHLAQDNTRLSIFAHQVLQGAVDHGLQLGRKAARDGRYMRQVFAPATAGIAQYRQVELLLGCEMVENIGFADARALGDGMDRRALIAVRSKDFQRGVEDLASAVTG